MIITDLALRELRDAFQLWALNECAEGRPYPAQHDWEVVCQTAKQWGAPHAKSAYARAFKALVEAKTIRPKQTSIPAPIPADFAAQIDSMSSTDLRKRLNTDRTFSELYGRWAAGEKPQGYVVKDEYELTAAQWRSLPPTVAAIKMRDARFRAGVDRLIQKGEI
jgi:hypothetical protein